jgi:hypothetical protein
MTRLIGAFLFSLAAVSSVDTAEATSVRCGNRLASKGDTTYEVRAACGDPAAAQQRVVHRVVRQRVPVACPPGSERRVCEIVVEDVVPVVIDEWTYDFGSSRFIEYLTFEQGRLIEVTTGGYGRS